VSAIDSEKRAELAIASPTQGAQSREPPICLSRTIWRILSTLFAVVAVRAREREREREMFAFEELETQGNVMVVF
jgi:hypothetical protein